MIQADETHVPGFMEKLALNLSLAVILGLLPVSLTAWLTSH